MHDKGKATGRTHIFQKPISHLKNSRHQKADMKQVPYWEPINIRHHPTKFSHLGDVVPGVCEVLVCHYIIMVKKKKIKI